MYYERPGTFSDWIYFHRGRLSLAARPWSPALQLALGKSRTSDDKARTKDDPAKAATDKITAKPKRMIAKAKARVRSILGRSAA